MDFHRFKDMDLVEQVHIFGLSNIHTFGPNVSQIRLFSLMLNYAKPQLFEVSVDDTHSHINKRSENYLLHLDFIY